MHFCSVTSDFAELETAVWIPLIISYISYVVGCGILINDHQHSYLHYQPGLTSDMFWLCDINRQTYPRETKACCHGPLGWCDRFYQGQEQSVADRSWAWWAWSWGWRGMAGWVKVMLMELQYIIYILYIYIISPPLEGYLSGGGPYQNVRYIFWNPPLNVKLVAERLPGVIFGEKVL